MEGKDGVVAAVGLIPDGVSVGEGDGARVAEAANATKSSEVVIEGAVLLHHEDDVFDIVDGAGAVVGGNRQRASDARGEGSGDGACA
jgi:hypothetical protein